MFLALMVGNPQRAEKSTPWTDAGLDQNFQKDLGAIGPYKCQGKFVWTNPLVSSFQGNLCGPMALKVRQKFPRDWHWSMDGSSQKGGGKRIVRFWAGGKRTVEPPPPKPVLEASENGIRLVCARFL